MDRLWARNCRNFPRLEKCRCCRKDRRSLRRAYSPNPMLAMANWLEASMRARRGKDGRSRNYTPRKGGWTKCFAASRCRTPCRRNGNELESGKHQGGRKKGIDRLFLLAGGLCISGDLFAFERIFHFHGRSGAVFRIRPGLAGDLLHLAALAVSVSGSGGGDEIVVGGTPARNRGVALDHAHHGLAGHCREISGLLAFSGVGVVPNLSPGHNRQLPG